MICCVFSPIQAKIIHSSLDDIRRQILPRKSIKDTFEAKYVTLFTQVTSISINLFTIRTVIAYWGQSMAQVVGCLPSMC